MDELAERVKVGVFDSVVDLGGTIIENLLIVPARVFEEADAEGSLVVEVLDELAEVAILLDLQLVVEEAYYIYHGRKQNKLVLLEKQFLLLALHALLVQQLLTLCLEGAPDLLTVLHPMMVMGVIVMGNMWSTALVVVRVAVGSDQCMTVESMVVECVVLLPLLQGGLP